MTIFLNYSIIDLIEGIVVAKSNNSKECIVYHYWCFNHGFKLKNSICNGCHDSVMLSFNNSNIISTTVKGVDYRCIIHNFANLMQFICWKFCA